MKVKRPFFHECRWVAINRQAQRYAVRQQHTHERAWPMQRQINPTLHSKAVHGRIGACVCAVFGHDHEPPGRRLINSACVASSTELSLAGGARLGLEPICPDRPDVPICHSPAHKAQPNFSDSQCKQARA